MLVLFAIAFVLCFSIYVAVFSSLPQYAKHWLVRHPYVALAINLLSIPLMVSLFGAGLIAGCINLGTSSLFVVYLKHYGHTHPEALQKKGFLYPFERSLRRHSQLS